MEKIPNFIISGKIEKEKKEEAEKKIAGNFGEDHLMNFDEKKVAELVENELPKTKIDLELISMANKETNELLVKMGLEPFDIPARNYHFVKGEFYKKVSPLENSAALANGKALAMMFNNDEFAQDSLARALAIFHESLHIKSLMVYRYNIKNSGDKIDNNQTRFGLNIFNENGSNHEHLRGLNEAITAHQEKIFLRKISDNQIFAKQKNNLAVKVANKINNGLFKKNDSKDDDIYAVDIFNKKIERVSYPEERYVLEYVCRKIASDLNRPIEGIYDEFLKSQLTGQLKGLVSLVEKSFGAGSFRELGRLDPRKKNFNFILQKLQARRGDDAQRGRVVFNDVKKVFPETEKEFQKEIKKRKITNASANLKDYIKERYFSYQDIDMAQDKRSRALDRTIVDPVMDKYAIGFVEMTSMHSFKKVEKESKKIKNRTVEVLDKLQIERSLDLNSLTWPMVELSKEYYLYMEEKKNSKKYILEHGDPLRDEHLDNSLHDAILGKKNKTYTKYDEISNRAIGQEIQKAFEKNEDELLEKIPKQARRDVGTYLARTLKADKKSKNQLWENIGRAITESIEGVYVEKFLRPELKKETAREAKEETLKNANQDDSKQNNPTVSGEEAEENILEDKEKREDNMEEVVDGDNQNQKKEKPSDMITGNMLEKYFGYQDLNIDDEQKKKLLKKIEKNSATKKYVEAFGEMTKKHQIEKVEERAQLIKKTFEDFFKKINIKPSRNSDSISWAIWDLAKQYYFFINPEKNDAKYSIEDPMESADKVNEIVNRQIGIELYRLYQKKANVVLAKIPVSIRVEAEKYLKKAPKINKMLSSKDLEKLGELVRGAVSN